MHFHSMVVFGGRLLIVPVQVGYDVGSSLTAEAADQLPNSGTLPMTYTDCPVVVVPFRP